ncbi:hypothetical protein KSP39_PZI014561 [Platanthera zijinensis]|uniref:Tetratricopeptide repeat protein 33 n=1 Tax=Platanthera zijinensis TaxID=2320716 RepID=A0AAP0BAY2_9ASPA
MKIAWKTKSRVKSISSKPNLPFESSDKTEPLNHAGIDSLSSEPNSTQLSASFESQGIQLAESGRYSEALTKMESAITLMPEKAKLHEQKAQLLLEIGDTWNALKTAKRATELEPAWVEAWITLGRAQLNYGEPDLAIQSFDNALEIKSDHDEALIDRQTASRLIKRRKQLHSSGLPNSDIRYKVGDKDRPAIPLKPLAPEPDDLQQ